MRPFLPSRLALAPVVAAALAITATVWSQAPRYTEPFRPQYHYTPEANWMNDPNGMVYFDSEYHLFYQYNPFGDKWGHMSWGHAISPDLVHWEHLPVAIPEQDGVMAFSGSIVVDWENTSGFGDGVRPPLVALYTGYKENPDKIQAQYAAWSRDRGRTWTQFPGNPVLDLNSTEFRDPKVFWYQPGGYWVMAVVLAKEYKASFYRSPDLKTWAHLSDFGPAAATGGVWECPDLFELPVTGREDESKWVLIVNIGDGAIAGGSNGQYFLGEFDGTTFVSDTVNGEIPTRWLDYGSDFYATVTWSDVPATDGRRLAIGWMNNWKYGQEVPTSPWRSAQSLVRELSLVRDDDQLTLVQSPVCEQSQLRGTSRALHDLALRPEVVGLRELGVSGSALELALVLEPGNAAGFGVDVAAGPEHRTRIGYDVKRGVLFIDRTNSGPEFHADFAGRHEAPVALRDGRLDLRVFLDGSLLEVFADGGRVTISDQIFPPEGHDDVALYAEGGTARLVDLQAWPLRSIWPAAQPAEIEAAEAAAVVPLP